MMPPPFAPGEGGSSEVGLGAAGDLTTTRIPPRSVTEGNFWTLPGVQGMGLSGVPAPPPPPPPPPPPREDDPTFVRRVRLTYLDRAHQSHQRVLLEESQEVNWTTPGWVFTVTWLSPYVACVVSIGGNVFYTLAYVVKFGRIEEEHWRMGFVVALLLWGSILEVIRGAIATVVELRKFEIRRRMAGGDFLQSRLRQVGSGARRPDVRLKGPPPMRPPVPTVSPVIAPKSAPPPPPHQPMPISRPAYLPAGAPPPPPGAPPPGAPMLRNSSGQSLPVAAALPPAAPGTPQVGTPTGGTPRDNATPRGGMSDSGRGQSLPPAMPPMRGGSGLLPGKLDSSPFGPSAQPQPPPMPGGIPGMPPSPTGSAVSAVSAALSEKLKASRVATPPPLPPGGHGRPPSGGSAASGSRGPRPPAAQAGGFTRTGSSMSGGSAPPKPPTPPPSGSVQQTRASYRARQQG